MEATIDSHVPLATAAVRLEEMKANLADIIKDLPFLRTMKKLTRNLLSYFPRDTFKEVASLHRIAESLRTSLWRGLCMASLQDDSATWNHELYSDFMPSSNSICSCCLTSQETHFESLWKLSGRSKDPTKVSAMDAIHHLLGDSLRSLHSLLSSLRLQLIRLHYLVRQNREYTINLTDEALLRYRDFDFVVDGQAMVLSEISHLLVDCTTLMDIVRTESSASLLNHAFQKLRSTKMPNLESSCRLDASSNVCTWMESVANFGYVRDTVMKQDILPLLETPGLTLHESTSKQRPEFAWDVVPSVSEREGEPSLTDKLPLEMWQKITGYLGDDDASLYSLLQASPKFREVLAPDAVKNVDYSDFWKDALRKRGVDLSRVFSEKKEVSWITRFHEYAQSMACFRCFSRLSLTSTSATESTTRSHQLFARIIKEANMLGNGVVSSNSRSVHSPVEGVLSVQFCNWEPGKTSGQQRNFDNLIISLLGPVGTPYFGGRFQLWIHFPLNYPFSPPRAQLLTKIISPYFTEHGDFYFPCNSVLGGGLDPITGSGYWSAADEFGHIVDIAARRLALSVQAENGEDAASLAAFVVVNHKVNELRRDNKEMFDTMARKHTQTHAMLNWMGPSLDRTHNLPLNLALTTMTRIITGDIFGKG